MSDLASLKKSVEFVGNQIKTPPASPDKFFTTMTDFYNQASQTTASLEAKLQKAQENFNKLAQFYGEPAGTPAEQFFNIVWTGIQSLERAKVTITRLLCRWSIMISPPEPHCPALLALSVMTGRH